MNTLIDSNHSENLIPKRQTSSLIEFLQTNGTFARLIDLLSTKQNDKSPDAIGRRGWKFVIGKEKVNKKSSINFAKFNKFILEGLSDLIYPHNCILCHRLLLIHNPQIFLCASCLSTIEHNFPPFCPKCSKHLINTEQPLCSDCLKREYHFDYAYSACFYNDTLRRLIHLFKYANKTSLRHHLGNLILSFLRTYHINLGKFDVLIPIPLHPIRFRERGYNQSHLLAQEIARHWKIPLSSDNLIRIRHTKNQALVGLKNRWTNIQGAFRIKHSSQFLEKSVLLVDDLLTTGTTVSEAARMLKEAGAKKVDVLTLSIGAVKFKDNSI